MSDEVECMLAELGVARGPASYLERVWASHSFQFRLTIYSS